MSRPVPRAVLIGPPGAGKSTIGRRLAQALGVEVFDTDAAIERVTGRTIPDIFTTDGEPAFREIEEQVVLEALRTHPGIVSLGGGAVLSPVTRSALSGHVVIYLEISIGEGLRRTGVHHANATRPLLAGDDPRAKYRELMRKRRPLYRGVATIRIRTDGRSPARVVAAVLDKMGVDRETLPAPAPTPAPRRPDRPRRVPPRLEDPAPGAVPTPADAAARSRRRSGSRRARRSAGRPIPTDPATRAVPPRDPPQEETS